MGRIMIAAVGSGSGKTTIVCGLLNALVKAGKKAVSCKCGPDYIDPMFHENVIEIKSVNIDLFFSDKEDIKKIISKHSKQSDITVIEGVMGFYDGMFSDSTEASSYHIAKETDTPVIIVFKCGGMYLTAAAVIKGIIDFKKDSNIKGIVLNNIKKPTYDLLKPVIEKHCGVDVLGFIPPLDKEYILKGRHLGLVIPNEIENLKNTVDSLGDIILKNIDINKIVEISETAPELEYHEYIGEKRVGFNLGSKKNIKIAIAYDNAFCFYYRSNLELLEQMGCNIVTFSPIEEKKLPSGTDGVIIGGGYPENYCCELSSNEHMKELLKEKLENGMPCIAECGGFMYLNKSIEDISGKIYNTVGFFDGNCFKTDRLVRFGYINLYAVKDTFVLKENQKIKAHEFHYWDCEKNGEFFKAVKPSGKKEWSCINIKENTVAGFPHLYYCSNTEFVKNFVRKCGEWR